MFEVVRINRMTSSEIVRESALMMLRDMMSADQRPVGFLLDMGCPQRRSLKNPDTRLSFLPTIDDRRRIPLHRHGPHEIRNADRHFTMRLAGDAAITCAISRHAANTVPASTVCGSSTQSGGYWSSPTPPRAALSSSSAYVSMIAIRVRGSPESPRPVQPGAEPLSATAGA
jgi:hypothetical protein